MMAIGRLFANAFQMGQHLVSYRSILGATTRLELRKRYVGSLLGGAWVILQPVLFLSIYLFLYLVVFRMRFPGYSELDYVLYVFAGLIPYMGLMEAASTGCHVVKQNIHLVKNIIMPIEVIPAKSSIVSLINQMISTMVLLVLVIINGNLSPMILFLPIVLIFQFLLMQGVVWFLSALTIALPDTPHFVNLFLLLLMFISPIGFKPDMVPSALQLVVKLNPVYYLTEMYRSMFLHGTMPQPYMIAVFVSLCLGTFLLGAAFFGRFKGYIVDLE